MKLTVGMCTHDDFDGVWFTIQSIRMYQPEVLDDIRFVVVDSNSDKPHGLACEKLISKLTNKHGNCGLYVKNVTWESTSSRNYVFQFAETPYVLCLDSHVMLAPGSLKKLINFYDKNPDNLNLHHGPLVDDNLKPFATRMDPVWEYNMYGKWIYDINDWKKTTPYEIPMMGLGLFTCTKNAWLGFNENYQGFGGEEGYIHEKYRKSGRKNIMLPWLKWLHRFERPNGVPYNPQYIDRVRNYYNGWIELGLDTTEITEYFRKPNENKGQERDAYPLSELQEMEREIRSEYESSTDIAEISSIDSKDMLESKKKALLKQLEDIEKQLIKD